MTAKPSTTALPRRRNLRGEGGRLKAGVIDATMRLLDRSPTAESSLRMAAKEGGVAAPSIYAHFPDAVEFFVNEALDRLFPG